jgi:hypothetical protein
MPSSNKAQRLKFQYPDRVVNGTRRDENGTIIRNGGWHPKGKRNYKKAVEKIMVCLRTYKKARLFHICFQGRTNDEHKALLKVLVERLERKGIQHEWFSARETGSLKGEHLHVFLLANADQKNPQSVLNTFEDQYLGGEAIRRGITVWVNRPRNAIHINNKYAMLPWLGSSVETTELAMERLNDALLWLTYIYKARDKPESANLGQIFSASRPERKRVTCGTTQRKTASNVVAACHIN